jgi:23S rRNA pseudouridine1911/1915/1917 synthase
MKYIGYPLVGDYLYNPSEEASSLSRQALHSHRLSFPHPMTGEPLEFVAPLPDDMQNLLI